MNNGIVKARRYRNRRVGDFLKELNLTEGKGTGIPTIKNALQKNNSPIANYDTDGADRRFFITELSIHSDFILTSINQESNQVNQESNQVNQESNQVNQEIVEQFSVFFDNKIKNKNIIRIVELLKYCFAPKSKNEIFKKIDLSNQLKNFKENIEPAIDSGLLSMTITDKPSSRNQKYITTEKGRRMMYLKSKGSL